MEAENMICVDDPGSVLEKEQLFASLGSLDSENKLYFDEPILIYGNNDSQRIIRLFFGYDTDWTHRAGTYRGKVNFTLSSSASPFDRWEE